MKVLYSWLQEYVDGALPVPEELADMLTFRAFEVESVERIGDGTDAVLDIDVLPNRTHDCLSHIGIAREAALLCELPFKLPDEAMSPDPDVQTGALLTLSVEDPILIPRATKRLITDVKVGPSPEWLVKRLVALGQRPINNIVDITNFIMLETGQPVHAFDFDKLAPTGASSRIDADQTQIDADKKVHIAVRRAKDGEKVTTLDGDIFTLTKDMLVIADEKQALDIAGIKGGADSGIDESTARVVLSACNFHPTNIRKTSRGLNLLTDASKRFEQGLSPEMIDLAVARASQLFVELAGGRVAEDVLDEYPRPRNPYLVGISTEEVNHLLGTSFSDTEMETTLTRLGFEWKKVVPREVILRLAPEYVGTPYKYGASISYDAPNAFDCSSFVAHLYAQAGIAVPRMTVDQFVFGTEIEKKDLEPSDIVFSRNENGTAMPEFVRVEDGAKTSNEAVKMVSKEFLPGTEVPHGVSHDGVYIGDGKIIHASAKWHKGEVILEELATSDAFKNIVGYRRMADLDVPRYVVTVPHERLDVRIGADVIEEIGRVYGYDNIAPKEPTVRAPWEPNKIFYYTNKIRDILVGAGFSEVMTYSFQNTGEVELENPLADDKKYLRRNIALLQVREDNERNAPLFGTDKTKIFEIGTVFSKGGEYTSLGFGVSGKKTDTIFSDIVEKIESAFGVSIHLKSQDGFAEINLSEYIENLPEPKLYEGLSLIETRGISYKTPSPYPFVLRDIALWVPEAVTSEAVRKVIANSAGSLLVRNGQFDEYEKDGRVSYAYHLVFQSYEKTLTDAEVNNIMGEVTDAVEKEGWEVR